MRKIKLILADPDSVYLKSFGEYLLSSSSKGRFEVKLFSSSESLTRYLSTNQASDILLLHPSFKHLESLEQQEGLVLTLKEDELTDEEELSVFKYQPLNQLLSDVLSLYYESGEYRGKGNETTKTRILSVYSPVGGSGKTTLAVNLSRQLALMDRNVFYLNLELINTTSLYFHTADDNPSLQVFYYLKANPKELHAKIEKLKKRDSASKVSYFDLLPRPDEMMNIPEEQITKLIDLLVETGEYDYVICDLDTALYPLTKVALQKSDQIIWLLNNDLQSFQKTNILRASLSDVLEEGHDIEERILFTMNRFSGQFSDAFRAFNLPIQAYLPQVNDWNPVVESNQIFFHPIYTKELIHFVKDVLEQGQERVAID